MSTDLLTLWATFSNILNSHPELGNKVPFHPWDSPQGTPCEQLTALAQCLEDFQRIFSWMACVLGSMPKTDVVPARITLGFPFAPPPPEPPLILELAETTVDLSQASAWALPFDSMGGSGDGGMFGSEVAINIQRQPSPFPTSVDSSPSASASAPASPRHRQPTPLSPVWAPICAPLSLCRSSDPPPPAAYHDLSQQWEKYDDSETECFESPRAIAQPAIERFDRPTPERDLRNNQAFYHQDHYPLASTQDEDEEGACTFAFRPPSLITPQGEHNSAMVPAASLRSIPTSESKGCPCVICCRDDDGHYQTLDPAMTNTGKCNRTAKTNIEAETQPFRPWEHHIVQDKDATLPAQGAAEDARSGLPDPLNLIQHEVGSGSRGTLRRSPRVSNFKKVMSLASSTPTSLSDENALRLIKPLPSDSEHILASQRRDRALAAKPPMPVCRLGTHTTKRRKYELGPDEAANTLLLDKIHALPRPETLESADRRAVKLRHIPPSQQAGVDLSAVAEGSNVSLLLIHNPFPRKRGREPSPEGDEVSDEWEMVESEGEDEARHVDMKRRFRSLRRQAGKVIKAIRF